MDYMSKTKQAHEERIEALEQEIVLLKEMTVAEIIGIKKDIEEMKEISFGFYMTIYNIYERFEFVESLIGE